jgi:hypothetical protein
MKIMPPMFRDGQWYGMVTVYVGGRPVDIIARADKDLIDTAYKYASKIIQYGGSIPKLPTMAGDDGDFPARGSDIARDSQFGRLLSRVSDSLPEPEILPDEKSQILANVALSAGRDDEIEAWQAIYDLNQDACQGDELALDWALSLKELVESAAHGGVAMAGITGPSLAATLHQFR